MITMPRRPRIAVAGVPLHIIQRGNNRQACLFSADDHRLYLEGIVLAREWGVLHLARTAAKAAVVS